MRNPVSKWLLGVVASTVIAMAGWAASSEVTRLDSVEKAQSSQASDIAVTKEAINTLKDDVKEMKSDLKEIRRLLERR